MVKIMIKTVIKAALLLLAISIAGFAIFLLIRGAPLLSVPVVEENVPLLEPVITYERPYIPAIFPILGSVLVLWGVLIKKMIVAWLGAAILVVYSVLFVFSWGGIFLLPGLILVALLLVYQFFYQPKHPHPELG